jgi:ribosomal protein S27AE
VRLIDGDALRDKSFMTGEHPTVNNPYRDLDEVVSVDDIDNAPTIDVAPVKHGHWIQVDKNKCECSNCGIIVLIAVYPHGDKNYCPNCGARMDGGDT